MQNTHPILHICRISYTPSQPNGKSIGSERFYVRRTKWRRPAGNGKRHGWKRKKTSIRATEIPPQNRIPDLSERKTGHILNNHKAPKSTVPRHGGGPPAHPRTPHTAKGKQKPPPPWQNGKTHPRENRIKSINAGTTDEYGKHKGLNLTFWQKDNDKKQPEPRRKTTQYKKKNMKLDFTINSSLHSLKTEYKSSNRPLLTKQKVPDYTNKRTCHLDTSSFHNLI